MAVHTTRHQQGVQTAGRSSNAPPRCGPERHRRPLLLTRTSRVTPSRSAQLQCTAAVATDTPPAAQGPRPSIPAAPQQRSVYTTYVGSTLTDKVKVVVLGSGWAAMSLVKALSKKDSAAYDITVVSPRNYFLYTPLLPACATGTVEERSIVEPVRRIMKGKGEYFEAVCEEVYPEEQAIVACFPKDAGLDEACFKVPYDILVVCVGCENNTFGIKGVREHTYFFKSVEDAAKLRRQVSECFERAALPHTPTEERRKLLSFVVVGGGPTGVEVAAELHDMVAEDLVKIYPQLMDDVRIRVIELQDHILSTYDRDISNYTQQQFGRSGIELVLNSKVESVESAGVTVANSITGEKECIPFGACVWATGVAMHPLIKQLQQRLPAGTQTHFRSILTDGFLRVKGSNGTIYAIGDDATVDQAKSLDKAVELFDKADVNRDGKLQLAELRGILSSASKEYSHLAEHARFLDGKMGFKRWGSMVGNAVSKARGKTAAAGNGAAPARPGTPVGAFAEDTELDLDQFSELLRTIDNGLRSLPATAQVARQEGEYLAKLLKAGLKPGAEGLPEGAQPFRYGHKGSLAYVGSDKAVMDVPGVGPIKGYAAGVMWKGFETYSQISFRNVCLVSLDWLRTKVFGRDISRV